MMNQPSPPGASAGFADRLLEVIDSGRCTATYKLALLIALLDLCARHSDAGGRAPKLLYTRDIAEQVAVLYWPQVIPYLVPGAGTAVELRQITLPRAAIIAAVSTFRGEAVAAGTASWHLARQRLPGAYQAMLDQVEVTVAEQPLPRLQAVGSSDKVFPFLYKLDWGPRESFSPARLRRHDPVVPRCSCCPAPATNSSGSGRWFVPWSNCTGPGWSRRSTTWPPPSSTCTVTCSEPTGSSRRRHCGTASPPCRTASASTAAGPLGATPEADHFIPRIRCGIDAVENLVLADRRCNNDKRDLLPAPRHVTAWARRNQRHGTALISLAMASRWDTDPAATMAVARSIYSHLPPDRTPLWLGFKNVGDADPAAAVAALTQRTVDLL
jgi:5-methylcytosine-specific restriction endonuclease McrA